MKIISIVIFVFLLIYLFRRVKRFFIDIREKYTHFDINEYKDGKKRSKKLKIANPQKISSSIYKSLSNVEIKPENICVAEYESDSAFGLRVSFLELLYALGIPCEEKVISSEIVAKIYNK